MESSCEMPWCFNTQIAGIGLMGITRQQVMVWALPFVWGVILSCGLVSGLFVYPPGEIFSTHEGCSYVYRLVEFQTLLKEGHLFPQWCGDFRGGLGSPFFSYYQPALFYSASVVPLSNPLHQLGIALIVAAISGYAGIFLLVKNFFDPLSAWVSATVFLLSVYPSTELYFRGDLSEFFAMMLFAAAISAAFLWLDRGRVRHLAFMMLFALMLVLSHPCVALIGFGALAFIGIYYLLLDRGLRPLFYLSGLVLAGFAATWYWLPIVQELAWVQVGNATQGHYWYANHFVEAFWLFSPYRRTSPIPFSLGWVVIVLLPINLAGFVLERRNISGRQWKFLAGTSCLVLITVFLMNPLSEFLWKNIKPLQLLQFPWRLFALLTAFLSILCGPIAFQLRTRIRFVVCATVVVITCGLAPTYSRLSQTQDFEPVQDGGQLRVQTFFAPDLTDEWLPKGAVSGEWYPGDENAITSSTIEVKDIRRSTNKFWCRVDSAEGGQLKVMHYAFPGWRATLDEDELVIHADERGFMLIDCPAGRSGELLVEFTSTPARRRGLGVSGMAILISLAFFGWVKRTGKSRPEKSVT